ncbi:MAG: hypothetical protein NZ521_10760, partial [Flammeovirgaceae bacterium]|nr:hypothetical protein [Flammeovirgaceae bacterium]
MKKVVLNIFLCIILLYPFSFSFAQLATAFDVHITIDSMFRLGYQVQETFDAVGRKKETHFLDKKGYKQGPVYWYYTNGKLKAKGYFKKDKLNGEYQLYNQEGRVLIFCTYQNGLLHGKYEQFFQDGKKAMEGAFVKGNKEGYFREYHYGVGSLRAEWKAVRGKRQGKGIWYYPNQKIHFICYFANDKLEGEYIVYDTIGRILKIQSYQNNLLHGEYIRYHPNGQIATKAT